MRKLLFLVLIAIVLIAGCTQQPTGQDQESEVSYEELCIKSGGTVITGLCCKSVDEFPDTCLIGACGCSPENSYEVKICDCGEYKCWDSDRAECITPPTTEPEIIIGPTSSGFADLIVVAPWNFYSNGTLEFKVANNVGEEIVVRKVYINDVLKSFTNLPQTLIIGAQSELITVTGGPTGTTGNSYSIQVTIEYYSTSAPLIVLTSTGILNGTYS